MERSAGWQLAPELRAADVSSLSAVARRWFIVDGSAGAYRIALKLRATRPPAQACWTTGRAGQGHNTPRPLERSPPASFKRLLGSAVRGLLASRQCAVLPVTC